MSLRTLKVRLRYYGGVEDAEIKADWVRPMLLLRRQIPKPDIKIIVVMGEGLEKPQETLSKLLMKTTFLCGKLDK